MASYNYRHRGFVVTANRRLSVGEVRQAVATHHATVAKAKKTDASLAIAYDAHGQAIGLIDPKNLQPLAELGPDESGPTEPKPIKRDDTPADPQTVGVATADVAKMSAAAAGARWRDGVPDPKEQAERASLLDAFLDKIIRGLGQKYGLRDQAEVEIAKQAVARVATSQLSGDMNPTAKTFVAMHASRAAVDAIERHRAQRPQTSGGR